MNMASKLLFIALSSLLFTIVVSGCGAKGNTSNQAATTDNSLSSPANVQCTAGTKSTTMGWDTVLNAKLYNIYFNTTGGVTTSDNKIPNVSSGFQHTGLLDKSTYYYVVTAVNDSGESLPSAEVSATTNAFKLPDTGQTQPYTDEFGEDSDYLINPPSYVDNGDGTQTDINTGLTWYISSNQGTWDQALSYCETLTFADYSDWRLPSAKELVYTADYDLFSSSYYWASTSNDFNADFAWVVSLPNGAAFIKIITDSYNIQCVREHQYTGQSFIDNGDETVTDINTDLMWQQSFFNEDGFEPALSYCENLVLAVYDDWRLPNVKELLSIVDHEKHWPSIDTTYFPSTHGQYYWSSTTDAASPHYIWHVKFDIGRIITRLKSSTGSKYIRCVRTIQ